MSKEADKLIEQAIQNELDDLISQATLRYPEGTVFKPIFGSKTRFTALNSFIVHKNGHNNICVLVKEKADTDDNHVSIYETSKGWAKILEPLKLEINNNYEIYG